VTTPCETVGRIYVGNVTSIQPCTSIASPGFANLKVIGRQQFSRLRFTRALGVLLGGGILFIQATVLAAGTPAAYANNAFARELMRELSATQGGENFAYSPFSIVTAFGMAYAGARGPTAAQMEEVFGYSGQEDGHREMRDWLETVGAAAQGETTTLELANRVWLQKDWPVESAFLQTLDQEYQAPVGEADFRTQPDLERVGINDWVYGRTKERIANLLPEGTVTGATRFLLVNALHFKGLWETPFNAATENRKFHVSPRESIMVPMMYGRMTVGHLATDLATAIALPIQDGSFWFVVVLPGSGMNVGDLVAAVADGRVPVGVGGWEGALVHMDVVLPRFRVEAELDLVKLLLAMGVVDAFQPGLADFTGIYTGVERELHLTAARHKAFVDVNQTGLEAAAATGIVGGVTSAYPVMVVDRPFLFFVTEESTGTILFAGQITRPQAPSEGNPEPTGFEAWRTQHFTKEELADPTISSATAAPAGDDVPNLLKCALGLGPMVSATDSLPRAVVIQREGGLQPGLEFTGASCTEVFVSLEVSKDLIEWREVSVTRELVALPDSDRARIRLVPVESVSAGVACFMRLRVQAPGN
jgi:serpin B